MSKRPLALVVVPLLAVLALSACGEDEPDEAAEPAASEDAVSCTYNAGGEASREVELPPETAQYTEPVEATVETTNGDLDVTLKADTAPCTVNSFASLAEQGYFDDTPCPRIVTDPSFGVLQCGDPSGTGSGGPGYVFDDELAGDETYPAGTLAMANSGPGTNGSQFFVVYQDSQLGPDYTVFGEVSEDSLSVIEEVAADGDDGSNPFGGGAPNTPIDLVSVTVAD